MENGRRALDDAIPMHLWAVSSPSLTCNYYIACIYAIQRCSKCFWLERIRIYLRTNARLRTPTSVRRKKNPIQVGIGIDEHQ